MLVGAEPRPDDGRNAFVIHADQSAPDPNIRGEIQHLVDSIRFD